MLSVGIFGRPPIFAMKFRSGEEFAATNLSVAGCLVMIKITDLIEVVLSLLERRQEWNSNAQQKEARN